MPAFPVDTHIHRLAARWGLSRGRSVVQTERDLKAVFPEDDWARRHLQIIYFGREHCPARGHDATRVPDLLVGGAAPAQGHALAIVARASTPPGCGRAGTLVVHRKAEDDGEHDDGILLGAVGTAS